MNLTPVQQKFVLHWGEMGTRWGINRTVGQIYALIYVSTQPLNADDIAETVIMNVLRGDVARLQRCTAITTGDGSEGVITRSVLGEIFDIFWRVGGAKILNF